MGFFLAQWTGWKWQNFKCFRCAKFSPCHCKSKIPAHLKLSTQMPTLNIFELRQRFRKSAEYFWRYRIFAGTVYSLKFAKFQMLSMRKVFTLPLQKVKYLRTWNFPTQLPTLNIFELRQRFRKSVEYLWRCMGFLLAQCTSWKWQNFKCCRCAKFSPFHCKSKIPCAPQTFHPNAHPKHLRAEAKISKIRWILLEI